MELEKGKMLHIKALAKGDRLTALGEREVFFELNGQLRAIYIQDTAVAKVDYIHFTLVCVTCRMCVEVGGVLRVLRFPSPVKLTFHRHITDSII